MKKLLALVLALVMTLSLATVSTNAAFEDAADIDYKEAADVLSAVGVFVGDGKNFSPKAALNREQAAKLVAYLALGEDVAEALPAVAMFDDVAASSWAAKYIAYCADAGIITGDGAGKFYPAAPVDGYAFAKMLLCALGYKAEAEGYTGTNWQINVATDAKEIELDDDFAGDLSKGLTREEAAQLMFNAIKAKKVTGYATSGSTVTIGDIVIDREWGAKSYSAKAYYELTWDTNNGNLTYDDVSVTDDFGRTSHSWTFDTKEVGKYGDTAKFVFTAEKSAKAIASELKGYYLTNKAYKVGNDTTLNQWATATGKTLSLATNGSVDASYAFNFDTVTTAKAIADLTADGKVVELYAGTDKVIDEIVVINYTLGEVTDVTKNAKTGYTTYTISGASACSDDPDAAVEVVLAGAVAEEDWVTFVEPTGAGKVYVYPTTKMVGEVVSVTNDGVATMGGQTYTASAAGSVVLGVSDEANYWLDQYGYVVKTTALSADASNFAYVVDAYGTWTEGFGGGVPAVQVKVVMTDGTVGTYELKIAKKDGAYKVIDIDGNAVTTLAGSGAVTSYVSALKNNTYSYAVSGNTIALTAATPFAAASVEGNYVVSMDAVAHTVSDATEYVVKNDTVIGVDYVSAQDTAVMNAKTTYIFWDASDEEVDAVIVGNTKLGDKKFTYNIDTDVVVSAEAGKMTAKYVFVMGGFATETESVDAYGYIDVSEYVVTKDKDGNTVRTYTLTMIDGSTVSVAATSSFLGSDGLYSYETDKSVSTSNLLTSRLAQGAAEVDGSIATIGGTAYNYTDDTKVLFLGDDTKLDGAATVFGWVTKKADGTPSNVLEAVFVVS